jgi:hypothetical protein
MAAGIRPLRVSRHLGGQLGAGGFDVVQRDRDGVFVLASTIAADGAGRDGGAGERIPWQLLEQFDFLDLGPVVLARAFRFQQLTRDRSDVGIERPHLAVDVLQRAARHAQFGVEPRQGFRQDEVAVGGGYRFTGRLRFGGDALFQFGDALFELGDKLHLLLAFALKNAAPVTQIDDDGAGLLQFVRRIDDGAQVAHLALLFADLALKVVDPVLRFVACAAQADFGIRPVAAAVAGFQIGAGLLLGFEVGLRLGYFGLQGFELALFLGVLGLDARVVAGLLAEGVEFHGGDLLIRVAGNG